MKKVTLIFLTHFVAQVCFGQTSIYSFKVDSVSGSHHIDFAAFQGKKILIVNTATADSNSYQFAELEELYQLYKDSLVIVAISSNSFNTEPRTNAQIASYCASTYNIHFPVSAKIDVTGSDADDLYKWLTDKALNTMRSTTMHGGFQKFLINKDGVLIAAFAKKAKPMSQTFRHLIEIL
jgi:glutathione peroxidase